MNEQLIVKNFGPIKDATVEFKKVTVFIGPTGGGKSTLAKLAAVFRDNNFMYSSPKEREVFFKNYSIDRYILPETNIYWADKTINFSMGNDFGRKTINPPDSDNRTISNSAIIEELSKNKEFIGLINEYHSLKTNSKTDQILTDNIAKAITKFFTKNRQKNHIYIPTERTFIPSIEYSWAGMLRDDIGLSKIILEFANLFNANKNSIKELDIKFLNATYIHQDGNDYIKTQNNETLLRLFETASGIQSVTPLLVSLEYLSRQNKQAQSFIVEEPELNLFPVAQLELVKILVDKCAKLNVQNDLILTTHSPYVLTALNLMCYAFRIAQQDKATAKKVTKLIPYKYWIDPEQFAAYYVDLPTTKKKQQVRSIINKKTGLIEENELDTASLELGEIFNKLARLRQPAKSVVRVK